MAIQEYKALLKLNPLFQDPLIRLAHIYYIQGDLNSAIGLCDQAIRCYSFAPNSNRLDVPFCLKANYLLDDQETERCLATLETLRHYLEGEDTYAYLTVARSIYLRSVNLRSDPTDQSKQS